LNQPWAYSKTLYWSFHLSVLSQTLLVQRAIYIASLSRVLDPTMKTTDPKADVGGRLEDATLRRLTGSVVWGAFSGTKIKRRKVTATLMSNSSAKLPLRS
jgi:hypothetical protein